MQNRVISRQDLAGFVDDLIKTKSAGDVIGIKAVGNKFNFGPLASAADLRLDYDVSLLPPKKYFFPQQETVLKYEAGPTPRVEPVVEERTLCIIGVHPFDIRALQLFDAVYGGKDPDPNYFLKRNNATIIGVDCLNPIPKSFAASMGTSSVEEGFDLMLTDLGGDWYVTVGSNRGDSLIKKSGKGKYLVERYKYLGCVGCGRCGSGCLADIALPADTYNLLKEAK